MANDEALAFGGFCEGCANPEAYDGLRAVLASRSLVYQLLQLLFDKGPTGELLAAACSEDALDAVRCLDEDGGAESALAGIRRRVSGREGDAEALSEWASEHVVLFHRGGKHAVPQWASVYVSAEGAAMSVNTVAAKQTYRAYGFEPLSGDRIIADSLETELDFMAKLAQRMVLSAEAHDGAALARDGRGSLLFLENHLLTWLPEFLLKLDGEEAAQLYYDVADLLVCFCRADAAWLAGCVGSAGAPCGRVPTP